MNRNRSEIVGRDLVGYDPMSETYHLEHDWDESTSLSYTVLRAVAAITGVEAHELDPLSETIDPDVLERVFDPNRANADAVNGCLIIDFNGCRVRIFADGHLEIEPPEV